MKLVEGQRRPYRMVARAEAAEATGQRILEAATALFGGLPYEQVSLEAIAHRASTTVQTIIRRFHTKDELLAEVITRRRRAIRSERGEIRRGDVAGALALLFDQYERWGDQILLFLAQEGRHPVITDAVRAGREFHHQWVKDVFGSAVGGSRPSARRRLHQVTVATDVYVWKVLRRDLRLGEPEARAAITAMVESALGR